MNTLSVNTINPLSGNNLILSGSNIAIPGNLTVTGNIIGNISGSATIGGIFVVSGSTATISGSLIVSGGNTFHNIGAMTTGLGCTVTSGSDAMAQGLNTIASGIGSHAEGNNTIASGSFQHVQGQYNTQGDSTSLMIVGNGTATNARKDAFKVRMSGSIVLPTTQSAAPSWTGTDGEMVFATVTGNHRFYVWMSGAWRSGSLS